MKARIETATIDDRIWRNETRKPTATPRLGWA
jgi:hypothetical protein